ncbi:MAG: hypothetical protein P4L53_00190 [Candidatus Obscuribacterales bacterium]|nr:hypothetical protein [Candidatus Obscuribacterales bacterium]
MVFENSGSTPKERAVPALRRQQKIFTTALSVSLLVQSQLFCLVGLSLPAGAQGAAEPIPPTGTLLIPLTPKLDSVKNHPAKQIVEDATIEDDVAPALKNDADSGDMAAADGAKDKDKTKADDKPKKKMSAGEEAMARVEKGTVEDEVGDVASEDTTLKGTIQIVADDTEYDQEKNTFLGTGNAVALIGGQDSKLEADTILYDQNAQIMDARGHVRILRTGQLTTGDAFKFKVTSSEYLITNPNTQLSGSEVIARKALGTENGVTFKNGTMTTPDPIYIARNATFGPLAYRELVADKTNHPDAYLPTDASFKFKAKKIVYERYKEQSNVTMYGARMEFNNFTIPLPKVVMTAGKATKVGMPVTFIFGNNMQVGGTNIGPRFNTQIAKSGVLSWAPLIQYGGVSTAGTTTHGFGLGGQVAFTNDMLATHIGYGGVSNLLVADLKAAVTKNIKFQSGINRYLSDGMFGVRRARLDAELVHTKVITGIPYLANFQFRTSGGWSEDNPQLLNTNSTYKQLFGSAANSTVMNKAWKFQEQLTATTHPIFMIGDTKVGAKSYIYGGATARGYSTGQGSLIGQVGPVVDIYLNRLRLQTGYTQSANRGSTPFVYDQFIQGTRSAFVSGSFKINKYLMVGGTYNYNIDDKLAVQKTVNIAVGPEDLKVIGAYDMIQGTGRIGFDVLYGNPTVFKTLVMKTKADQGQQGGI